MEARKHLLAARSAFLFSAFLPLEALNQRSVPSIENIEEAMTVKNARADQLIFDSAEIICNFAKVPYF